MEKDGVVEEKRMQTLLDPVLSVQVTNSLRIFTHAFPEVFVRSFAAEVFHAQPCQEDAEQFEVDVVESDGLDLRVVKEGYEAWGVSQREETEGWGRFFACCRLELRCRRGAGFKVFSEATMMGMRYITYSSSSVYVLLETCNAIVPQRICSCYV